LTDVIACVPLEDTEFDTVPSEYLNQLLNLIAQLRGGGSRFLPLLLAKVSENLPFAVPPSAPLTHIQVKRKSNRTSPAESPRSAPLTRQSPLSPLPMGALTPTFTDPMPSGSSPPGSSEGLPLSPWTPKVEMLAPVPRSVPRVNFSANYG
jgi:hypothetical protein